MQSSYIAPPQLITLFNPASTGYWKLVRWNRAAAPYARAAARLVRQIGTIIGATYRFAAQHRPRRKHPVPRHSFKIPRLSPTRLFSIRRRDLAKGILNGATAVAVVLGLIAMSPQTPPQHTQPVMSAKVDVVAVKPDILPIPKRARKQDAVAATLARFHADAQTFTDTQGSIEALADALNIPPAIVTHDVARAIGLAHDNSNAMKPYVGRFPLPANTDTRLLVALTPSDIPAIERLIVHAASLSKPSATLEADLPSGDLRFETRVAAMPPQGARACFRHAMTFVRRTFRHRLDATACRQGTRWFLAATQPRSAP